MLIGHCACGCTENPPTFGKIDGNAWGIGWGFMLLTGAQEENVFGASWIVPSDIWTRPSAMLAIGYAILRDLLDNSSFVLLLP